MTRAEEFLGKEAFEAEIDANNRLQLLAKKFLLKSIVIKEISDMNDLSTAVHSRLNSLANSSPVVRYTDSRDLLDRARNAVFDPTLDAKEYELAVEWSKLLIRAFEDATMDRSRSFATLGAAQFRLGRHENARDNLARAGRAVTIAASEEEVVSFYAFIWSFLSMAEHKIGETSLSETYLERLKGIPNVILDKVEDADRLKQLIKEAAQVVGNTTDPEQG